MCFFGSSTLSGAISQFVFAKELGMALSGVGSLGEDNRPLWNLKPNTAGAGQWIIFGPSPFLGFIS